MTTLDRLNRVVDKCFGPVENLTTETKVSDLTADSMNLLEFILQIEEEFGIDLEGYEEITLDSTLAEVVGLVEPLLKSDGETA